MQEPCSTLASVGHFGHGFSAFWPSHFPAVTISQLRGVLLPSTSSEAMDNDTGNGSQTWDDSYEDEVMREVSNRPYSTALKSCLHDGSTPGSSAFSLQPALIHYDEETLKDATTSNELPSSPCSLYFKCATSTFELRSLLQNIKKIGISLASV